MGMNVYVLTIDDIKIIKDKFSTLLNRKEFNLNIVQGLESKLNLSLFDEKKSYLRYNKILSKGEKLCSLGHFKIYDLICKSNTLNWSLIIEDDAIFDAKSFIFFEQIKSYKFNEPTILILGHSKTIPNNLWFQKLKQPLYKRNIIFNYKIGEKKINYFGTVGYIINLEAAKLLSKMNDCYWKADDWVYFQKNNINILHLDDPIIWEDQAKKNSSTGNSLAIHHNIFSANFFVEIKAMLNARFKLLFNYD
jgi:GR25 family glycosyltransferase involved in LPS biosynthesis